MSQVRLGLSIVSASAATLHCPELPMPKIDALYISDKRTSAWLKLKKDYVTGLGDSLDLVPVGAWHGNGRKAQWWSPILLAVWDPDAEKLVAVCKCMSGESEQRPADSICTSVGRGRLTGHIRFFRCILQGTRRHGCRLGRCSSLSTGAADHRRTPRACVKDTPKIPTPVRRNPCGSLNVIREVSLGPPCRRVALLTGQTKPVS